MAPQTKRAPRHRKKPLPTTTTALTRAAKLVHQICCVAGSASLIEDARSEGSPEPLGCSIERLDTPALFNWLVAVISFQGISDRAAASFMRKHGSITWLDISYRLSKKPSCPKLKSYWHFNRCGYQKSARSCARPDLFARCPLPKHRLRNGRLNQAAYSLYFFLRDVMGSDLVNWIDHQLSWASLGPERNRLERWRESIIGPMRNVFGLADKVLSMAFASLLLAAQDGRTHWHELGGSFIAIDTLVHKFLHRTGILKSLRVEHPYGPQCYEEHGCTGVVSRIAKKIDAREFNRKFPRCFARFIQHAIWRYCAQDGLDVCNSNRVDDRKRCSNIYCRVYGVCARERIVRSK
jgi:hypothetical protein